MKFKGRILAVLVFFLSSSTGHAQALFTATPLTDFTTGQTYAGFSGGLWENGLNEPPTQKLSDLETAANAIADSSGPIGVVSIGMSNWQGETCTTTNNSPPCQAQSYFVTATNSGANPNIKWVNCAQGGEGLNSWAQPTGTTWATCMNTRLPAFGVTADEVQVVIFKDVNVNPVKLGLRSLSALGGQPCTTSLINTVDECQYLYQAANDMRVIVSKFPNVKLIIMHSRIYGGYAQPQGQESPEPFAYESGFHVRALIEAQDAQVYNGIFNQVTGTLPTIPIAWGAYFWAPPCPTTRSDGLCWARTDVGGDGTHPTSSGIAKVVNGTPNMMLGWSVNSLYAAPWFN